MHVAIGGFDIAMPRSTGVATYGRMLTQAPAGGRHRIDGIFGLLIAAAAISNTGQINAWLFQHGLPDSYRILNATNPFHVTHRHFRVTGRFLRVRVPAPVPEIMHRA